MNIVILDAKTLGHDISFDCLETLGNLKVFQTTAPDEIISHLEGANVAILNKVRLSGEVLCKLPDLKLICVAATGYDNIDTSFCRQSGIAVCNVKGYSTHSVSLLTCATALSLASNLVTFNNFVKSGDYTNSGVANCLYPVFHEMCGKIWGIIGYGDIGRQVGNVAKSMGCEVLAYKRTPVDDAKCVSLEELAEKSDIITIHLPGGKDTEKIVDEKIISLMKKDVILVNSARGSVIDEEAVTKAVLDGKIAGYGCDVYTTEPFPKNHPYNKLFGLSNVIFTPHMAWAAFEARVRVVKEIALNIETFYNGEKRNRVE